MQQALDHQAAQQQQMQHLQQQQQQMIAAILKKQLQQQTLQPQGARQTAETKRQSQQQQLKMTDFDNTETLSGGDDQGLNWSWKVIAAGILKTLYRGHFVSCPVICFLTFVAC